MRRIVLIAVRVSHLRENQHFLEDTVRRFTCISVLLILLSAMLWAQKNPMPLVNQPLIPTAVAPGGAAFTLTVNGTGFAPNAVLNWNRSPRTTVVVSGSSLQATINASDVARLGTASITITNPTPGGGTSNVVYFPVRVPATAVAFGPDPNADETAGAVAVADFTGDRILDLAVGATFNTGTGEINLCPGRGDGTFAEEITTRLLVPVQSLLVGDFNGDSFPDLLVGTTIERSGASKGIALLNLGRGLFDQAPAFGIGTSGGPVAVGDFNGDGILDVVFDSEVAGVPTVSIFLGKGDETFILKHQQSVSGGGSLAAVGDFNGDGKLDLAVPNPNGVSVFLGNGDGTFQPNVSYSLSCSSGSASAADLNGDGKLDLVVGGFCILTGNGDGTFTIGDSYAAGPGPVAIGDFNGDGELDVATVGTELLGGQEILVFLGNGDGTFQSPDESIVFSSTLSSTFAFGDFNHDGQLDLALPGGSFPVDLQTALSVLPRGLVFPPTQLGATSPPQNVTLTNVGATPLKISRININNFDSRDFREVNNCGSSIEPGGSCIVSVTFAPLSAGPRLSNLGIAYPGPDNPQTVGLTGTGTD
jgi:hypothetical protein